MALRRFLTGLTYSIYYDFRDDRLGVATNVDTPVLNVYTPQKTLYLNQSPLTTTSTIGTYKYDLFIPVGLTIGHWTTLGVGISQSSTLFSDYKSFEVMDVTTEPNWVSMEELRTFLELEDTDHDNDEKLKQALSAAIELVEGYTQRHYGVLGYNEIIEVNDSDRVILKHFPIDTIVALTPTIRTIPRDRFNTEELISSDLVNLYYRLDAENGILKLVDSAGFDCVYENVLVAISYLAGFATVPEPVRQAVLSLAATINNLSCSEGIESMRFADISFATDKQLFKKHIGEMLAPYKNIFKP